MKQSPGEERKVMSPAVMPNKEAPIIMIDEPIDGSKVIF